MSSRSIGVTNVVVEAIDDVVRDPVAFVLALEDLAGQVAGVREVDEHPLEQVRRLHHVLTGLLKQLEVSPVARREQVPEARHPEGWYSRAAERGPDRAPRPRGLSPPYGVSSSPASNVRSSSSSIE